MAADSSHVIYNASSGRRRAEPTKKRIVCPFIIVLSGLCVQEFGHESRWALWPRPAGRVSLLWSSAGDRCLRESHLFVAHFARLSHEPSRADARVATRASRNQGARSLLFISLAGSLEISSKILKFANRSWPNSSCGRDSSKTLMIIYTSDRRTRLRAAPSPFCPRGENLAPRFGYILSSSLLFFAGFDSARDVCVSQQHRSGSAVTQGNS